VALVILELTSVLAVSRAPDHVTIPMHMVANPVTIVDLAVWPLKSPYSTDLIVFELSFVDRAISNNHLS
jgi:hypothetical protein